MDSHYSSLLQTVSDLKAELEKNTAKIKVLEEQNYHLSSNYSVVKTELVETRKKYNEAREHYLNAVNEKFEMERRHEQFVERLKLQLAEKTREFEAIRDKLVPHDIDQLRIKVQEELEVQHKQELKLAEEEAESQREKFFALKRELEKSKSEYLTLIQNQQQEIFSLRAEKEALEESFRRDINTSFNLEPVSFLKDDKIRAQANKAGELARIADKLREEVIDLRKSKDQAAFLLEEARAKYDQTVNHLKSKNAILEAERASFQEKISRLEQEIEKKESHARSLKLNLEELTNQIDHSLKVQEGLQQQISSQRFDHLQELEVLKEQLSEETKELHEEINSLSTKVSDREDHVRRLQRDVSEVQLRAENTEAEIRRSHHTQLQDLRKRYTAIELELVESKQNARLLDEQISLLQEQNLLERETLSSEVARVKREKEFLHAKIRELEHNSEQQKKKILSIQQEQLSKIASFEKKVRDSVASITSLEIKNDSLQTRNNDLEKEKNVLNSSLQRLQQENAELIQQQAALRKEFQLQLEAIGPTFKQRVEELSQKWKAAVSKEKKRADAYKSKAVQAHNKIKSLVDSGSGKDS